MPQIDEVDDLDGGPSYPVITGDYDSDAALGLGAAAGRARRWPRPSRCSPSSTPRWSTRSWPGSAHDHVPEAERSIGDGPGAAALSRCPRAGAGQPHPPGHDRRARWPTWSALGPGGGHRPHRHGRHRPGVLPLVGARCADEHHGVYAAVAIHPNETQAVSAEVGAGAPAPGSPAAAEVLAEIEAWPRWPRVVAVGETGLDYYRHHAEPDVQRRLVPRAHHDRQADRQGADDPRPGRARRRAAHPGGGGPAGPGGVPLLLRRRGDGQAVRRGGLRACRSPAT